MSSQLFVKTRAYYLLTKPGIILGNLITTIAGFALASKGRIDIYLFFATLVGLFGVIASACVFNNYIDREADRKMARTKNRALASGFIAPKNALLFAAFLGAVGFLFLILYTNLLTTGLALVGFLVYILLYSHLKYRTTYATLIGSIAGAVPPVVGYTAAAGRFDLGSAIFFAILVFWQMPHFFAIAMVQFNDYAAASIPVLPIKKGAAATKIQMVLYVTAFGVAAPLLTFYGYTGQLYFFATLFLSLAWLWLAFRGFKASNDKIWARKMFLFSLVVITALCIIVLIDS